MRILLSIAALAVAGCNTFQRGACESLYLDVCDICDISDMTADTLCACLEEGEVDDEDYFADGDAAEYWCADLQASVKATYQTNEDIAYCREQGALLKEWDDEWCKVNGFDDDGGYYYYR